MDRGELEKIILEAAIESGGKKKLPCAKAFVLAGEYAVGLNEIGDCCNRIGVKISKCQLGCF